MPCDEVRVIEAQECSTVEVCVAQILVLEDVLWMVAVVIQSTLFLLLSDATRDCFLPMSSDATRDCFLWPSDRCYDSGLCRKSQKGRKQSLSLGPLRLRGSLVVCYLACSRSHCISSPHRDRPGRRMDFRLVTIFLWY